MKRSDFVLRMKQVLSRRRDTLRKTLTGELALLGRNHDLEPVRDSCDEAQDSTEDEVSSALAQTESRELRAIENALEWLRQGNYGICQDCGRHIPLARLKAIPYATSCIKCQRESEEPGRCEVRMGDWSGVADSTANLVWTLGDLECAQR
jgi:DnaK suppressor protein